MSQRLLRVNELLKREISEQIHSFYRGETVYITITAVDIDPDLRHGRVFYSVLGGPEKEREARQFFSRHKEELRRRVGKRVVLKYLPHLEFIIDHSIEKGMHLVELLDEIEEEDKEGHE